MLFGATAGGLTSAISGFLSPRTALTCEYVLTWVGRLDAMANGIVQAPAKGVMGESNVVREAEYAPEKTALLWQLNSFPGGK